MVSILFVLCAMKVQAFSAKAVSLRLEAPAGSALDMRQDTREKGHSLPRQPMETQEGIFGEYQRRCSGMTRGRSR